MRFVAGSGGNGACTFHSEPRKEWGGPDGGNGGDGGNIIIKGENSLRFLFASAAYCIRAGNNFCSCVRLVSD